MKIKHKFILLLFVLVLIFFWKIVLNPTEMLYSEHSDTVGQYYFWKYFIQDSVNRFGELPLWNPHTFGGQPFVGNFHSEMFYPLFVFFYFLPIDILFGWLFILHIFLAGTAMYFLLKEFKLDKYSSLVGAIVYTFSGYVITHVYAGHVSFMATVLSVPLAFLFFEKAVNQKSYFYAIITGGVLGMQFLAAHPQFFFYTVFILFCYFLVKFFGFIKKDRKHLPTLVKIFALIGMVSLLLSAIQLFPSLEFAKYSSRAGGVDKEFATKLSMPPWETVSFVMPTFFGNPVDDSYWGRWNIWEINGHIGVLALILALFALIYRRNRHTYFFSGAALFSVLFAFGKYSPLYWLFYYLIPGFNFFRGPSKMLFFYTFAMAILVGFGVSFVIKKLSKTEKVKIKKMCRYLRILAAIVLLGVFVGYLFKEQIIDLGKNVITQFYQKYQYAESVKTLGLSFFLDKVEIIFGQVIRSSFVFIIMLILSLGVLFLKIKDNKYFRLALVILIVFDLWFFGMQFIDTRGTAEIFPTSNEISILSKDDGYFRVLDLDDELQQSVAVQHGLEMVKGYDPMITGDYYSYAAIVGGIESASREVLPIEEIKNKEILNLLNVKYILSDRELDDYEHIEGRVYLNKDYVPRAFVVADEAALENFSKAQITHYSPNKIVVEVDEPGLLVLSENFYPGWKAYADGKQVKIYKVQIFRAVNLEGANEAVFVYEPQSYSIGRIITLSTLLILIIFGVIKWKKIKR